MAEPLQQLPLWITTVASPARDVPTVVQGVTRIDGIPAQCYVQLMTPRGVVVAAMESDYVTGEYQFNHIPAGRYIVYVHDMLRYEKSPRISYVEAATTTTAAPTTTTTTTTTSTLKSERQPPT